MPSSALVLGVSPAGHLHRPASTAPTGGALPRGENIEEHPWNAAGLSISFLEEFWDLRKRHFFVL